MTSIASALKQSTSTSQPSSLTSLNEKLLVEYPTKRVSFLGVRIDERNEDEEDKDHQSSLSSDQNSSIDSEKDRRTTLHIRTDISKLRILNVMLYIGSKGFGGPMTQVEIFRTKFIEQLEWMDEAVFEDILSICCSIPGSTVAQLAISIGTLMTNSWLGGIFAFIGFTLPSAIIMGMFGCVYRITELVSIEIPCYFTLALHGFASASVAVVVQTAWKYSEQMEVGWRNVWMIVVSMLLFVVYEQPLFMIALMVMGGFAMQMVEENNYSRFSATAHLNLIENADGDSVVEIIEEDPLLGKLISSHKGLFGKTSIYIYLGILGILLLSRIASTNFDVEQAISFYYVGSLLTGGGHVGVPLLLSEFPNVVSKDAFFNGFSVNTMLPGPVMNLAVYLGGFSHGLRGAVIGYVFLFLPTFFFIWGMLPYWHSFKKDPHIMHFIKGAGIVSIGFVFATAFKLYQNAGQDDIVTSTFLVMISFILLNIYDMPAPWVVLIGGGLTVVRYLSLHDYRGVEETGETC